MNYLIAPIGAILFACGMMFGIQTIAQGYLNIKDMYGLAFWAIIGGLPGAAMMIYGMWDLFNCKVKNGSSKQIK